MLFASINKILLAIALPSLRTSTLLFRIAAIVILYAVALSLSVIYIQSIGSGIGIFSGLFPIANIYDISIALCQISSLVPVKPDEAQTPRRLTDKERSQFILQDELKQILVGLIMGDLYIQKKTIQKKTIKNGAPFEEWALESLEKPYYIFNPYLKFAQGTVHQNYLFHLYDLFKSYCRSEPKITTDLPHKRTGKIYTKVRFITRSLPCFNELYELFYPEGKKIIPLNIGDLLTPLGLAYWICDDGSFCKRYRVVILNTQGFRLEEVNLLAQILNDKFTLNCTINKNRNSYVIRIPKKSLPILQALLKRHMPSMMLYKLGL